MMKQRILSAVASVRVFTQHHLPVVLAALLCAWATLSGAQQLESRLIVEDAGDSLLLKASMGFDRDGNYCFQVEKGAHEQYFFLPGGKRVGPFDFIGNSFSSNASILDTYRQSEPDSPWYYANYKGARLFGPVRGRQIRCTDGGTRHNMAMVVGNHDTIYTYINGLLKHKMPGKAEEEPFSTGSDWCAFSPNGNVLYALKTATGYSLYLNDKLLHHSPNSYSALHVNDKGDYLFATGEKPAGNKDYSYWFFIHTRDTVLGPVRTVWQHKLHQVGSYYFTGDDNGTSYLAVNNRLYKGLKDVSHIVTPDPFHAMFCYISNGKPVLNVDGVKYPLNYERILYATMDRQKNFACYGLRKYYLYPFVNGKELPPLSGHGVRPIPVYISPEGSSYHIFVTDDSSYIYHDSMMMFPPLANSRHVKVADGCTFFDNSYEDNIPLFRPLTFIEVDSTGYFIYNGRLSHPLQSAFGDRFASAESPQAVGQILAGAVDHSGYYILRKTGPGQYEVLTDQTSVAVTNGPDKIIPGEVYRENDNIVFFGMKGRGFYRYKLKL